MSFGTSSSSSQGSGQQTSASQAFPYNLQNPAFVGLAPGVAAGLAAIYGSGPNGFSTPSGASTANSNASAAGINYGGSGYSAPSYSGGTSNDASMYGNPGSSPGLSGSSGGTSTSGLSPFLGYGSVSPQAYQPPGGPGGFFSPFSVGGSPSNNPNTNPLVAPVTGQQWQSLGNIGAASQPGAMGITPGAAQNMYSAFTNPGYTAPGTNNIGAAFNTLSSFLNPNYASNLATSPQTQAAIGAATNPIEQAFRSQTVPQLGGSTTMSGQRSNGPGQAGSSAFDAAFGNAAGNEQAAIGQTAGGIANQAYQTGLGIQANAPNAIVSNTGQLEQQAGTAATTPVQIGSTELNNMISSLSAEVLPQLTQQYGINQGTQLFQTQVQYLLQALGLGGQISQPSLGYSQQSEGQGTQQNSSQSSGFNLGVSSGILGGSH